MALRLQEWMQSSMLLVGSLSKWVVSGWLLRILLLPSVCNFRNLERLLLSKYDKDICAHYLLFS